MLLRIPGVFDAEQVRSARALLATAEWVDGRQTAGWQGAAVKHNRQLAEGSALARQLGDEVLAALERHPLFISAALPHRVYPPLFNLYEAGMQFGSHVDNAIRLMPGSGLKIRTDISATLFLSEPHEYDGGELHIEDTYGAQQIKLPAGDLIVYPGTSLHRVTPVTRGQRLASFFWTQSLVRDDAQRTLLFDLDSALQRLNGTQGDPSARLNLANCYHNLLRMWSDA
jgi:PKHD-type hydroxylase